MSFPGALCKVTAACRPTLGQVSFLELRPALLILPVSPSTPTSSVHTFSPCHFHDFFFKIIFFGSHTSIIISKLRTISTYILKNQNIHLFAKYVNIPFFLGLQAPNRYIHLRVFMNVETLCHGILDFFLGFQMLLNWH